jgi:dipeptidase E
MQKLFLASEAMHPKSLERLNNFINDDISNKNIAYIPTAQNGKSFGAWKKKHKKNILSLGAKVQIVELENYENVDIIRILRNSDIVWFEGGKPGYLLYWIRRAKLDKELPKILDKGVVYVGSSAGSMICSKNIYVTDYYLGNSEHGASLLPGLSFIDFEIYPHFEESKKDEIEEIWPKNLGELYLLKDGDVIVKDEGEIKVLGEKFVVGKN